MNETLKKIKLKPLNFNKQTNASTTNTRDKDCIITCEINSEINLTYKTYDEEYLKDSFFKIEGKYDKYCEITKIIDGVKYIKYAAFKRERKQNHNGLWLIKGEVDFLSNTRLKYDNLISLEKNRDEIRNHFNDLIDKFDTTEEIKTIYKSYFEKYEYINHLPILYFNEEKNKKEWYIPNYAEESDIFLDYDSEIPYLPKEDLHSNLEFKNVVFNYIVLNKEGIKGVNYNYTNKILGICDFKFDKNKFYFKDLINTYKNSHNFNFNSYFLIKDNTSKDVENDEEGYNFKLYDGITENKSLYYGIIDEINESNLILFQMIVPKVLSLNEEATIELLDKTSSKESIPKTLKDVKKYLNKYTKEVSQEEMAKYQQKTDSIYFVSNHLNISEKTMNLSCLNIYDSNIDFYKIPIPLNAFENLKVVKDYKNEDYYIVPTEKKDMLLIKDRGLIEFKGYKSDYNLHRMFSNYSYVESSFVCLNKNYKNDSDKIINLNEKINLKQSFESSFIVNEDGDYVILHNENDKLFGIDVKNDKSEVIEVTQKFEKFNKSFIKTLNLKSSNNQIELYKTDESVLHLPIIKKNEVLRELIKEKIVNESGETIDVVKNNNQDEIKQNYLLIKKNENNEYHIKTQIPLINNARNLKYVNNINNKWFEVKNNKMQIKETEYLKDCHFMDIEYVFNEDFFYPLTHNIDEENRNSSSYGYKSELKNLTDLYFNSKIDNFGIYKEFDKYLKYMKINGVEYSQEASLTFLNNINLFPDEEDITFNIKKGDGASIIEFINKKNKNIKCYLIKNEEKKFELNYFFNNNMGSAEILDMVKKDKIISSQNNEIFNKSLFFTKDKMFFVDKLNGVTTLKLNYGETQKLEDSVVNNPSSLKFIKEKDNELMEIIVDKEQNIKGVKNLNIKESQIIKNLSSYDCL